MKFGAIAGFYRSAKKEKSTVKEAIISKVVLPGAVVAGICVYIQRR